MKLFKKKSLVEKSYAKINIVLNVLGKREDGYHEVDMIMLPITLHDSLEINIQRGHKDNFVTFVEHPLGGSEFNLCTIAIERLMQKTQRDETFKILINKVIPISAGLGGGSSNAAATLLGINKLLNLNQSEEELINIGATLGSDVPFFIHNKPARVTGRGEKLRDITIKNDYYVLIVKPMLGLSTKEVYKACDEYQLDVFDVDKVEEALKEGNDELLKANIGNSLEKPSIMMRPEVQATKDKLKEFGLDIVLMSGSGSSVFAMSQDKKSLKKARDYFDKTCETFIAKVIK